MFHHSCMNKKRPEYGNERQFQFAPPMRRRHTKVDLLDDPLPEHAQYRDTGCEVAPACLKCPLPACRYELRGGLAAVRRQPRNRQVIALHQTGMSVEGLSDHFGLSRRSIFRILASSRSRTKK